MQKSGCCGRPAFSMGQINRKLFRGGAVNQGISGCNSTQVRPITVITLPFQYTNSTGIRGYTNARRDTYIHRIVARRLLPCLLHNSLPPSPLRPATNSALFSMVVYSPLPLSSQLPIPYTRTPYPCPFTISLSPV